MLGLELVGKNFEDQYEILQLLGCGGMGTVYKAREIELDRIVAIKLLHHEEISDDESRMRFELEGKILADLNNSHIVTFYRFGVSRSGVPFIVTEYLEGVSLRKELSDKDHLPWRRVVQIGIQICDALEYAHKSGIVHRDLKPDNVILLRDGDTELVKLLDFGLAKVLPSAENVKQKLTRTGELIGSVHYMSPEQCNGSKTDKRTDIYALACMLFEAICGHAPFTADNPVGIIFKHMNETMPLLAVNANGEKLPGSLDTILRKSMAKSADARYQNMAELRGDLKLLLGGATEGFLAQETGEPATKSGDRMGGNLFICICGALLMSALLLLAMFLYEPLIARVISPIVELPHNEQSVRAEVSLAKQLAKLSRTRAATQLYHNAFRLQQKISKDKAEGIDILIDWSALLDQRSNEAKELQKLALQEFSDFAERQRIEGHVDRRNLHLVKHLAEIAPGSTVSYFKVWVPPLDHIAEIFVQLREFDAAMQIPVIKEKLLLHQFGKRAFSFDLSSNYAMMLIKCNHPEQAEQLFEARMAEACSRDEIRKSDLFRNEYRIATHFSLAGQERLAAKHMENVRVFFKSHVDPDPLMQNYDRLIIANILVSQRKIGLAMPIYKSAMEELLTLPLPGWEVTDERGPYFDHMAELCQTLFSHGYFAEELEMLDICSQHFPEMLTGQQARTHVLLLYRADVLMRLGQESEAVKLYSRALISPSQVTKANYRLQLEYVLHIAEAQLRLCRVNEATKTIKDALEIVHKFDHDNKFRQGMWMNLQGECYKLDHKVKEAFDTCKKASQLCSATTVPSTEACVICVHLYELSYLMKNYAEGDRYAATALKWMKQDSLLLPRLKIQLLEALGHSSFGLGRNDDAIRYMDEVYQCLVSNSQLAVPDCCNDAAVEMETMFRLHRPDDAKAALEKWKKISTSFNAESLKLPDWQYLDALSCAHNRQDLSAMLIYKRLFAKSNHAKFRSRNLERDALLSYSNLLRTHGQLAAAEEFSKRAQAIL